MRLLLKNTRRIFASFIPAVQSNSADITTVNGYDDADCVFEKTAVENTYFTYVISDPTVTITDNSDPAVLDQTGFPVLDRLIDGLANITVQSAFARKATTLNFKTASESFTKKLVGYATGTASKLAYDVITAKLAANSPRDHNYYNANSYSTGLLKNESCWAADFDFSCVPIKHLDGGFAGGGVAITPRHVWATHHYTDHDAQLEFKFLGNDGVIYTRSVIGQSVSANLGRGKTDTNQVKYDTHVYTLALALPESVVPAKIADAWIRPAIYLDSSAIIPPCIFFNQQRKAKVAYVHMDGIQARVGGISIYGVIGAITADRQGDGPLSTLDFSLIPEPLFLLDDLATFPAGASGSPFFVPLGNDDFAIVSLASYTTTQDLIGGWVGGFPVLETVLNACIVSSDNDAGVTTGLSVTVAPDPTL